MKRYIVLFSCLAVLYAGAVWAYEGCRNLVGDGAAHHQGGKPVLPPSRDAAPSHHDHSDSGKIHCLNFFGEFVLTSKVALNPDRGPASSIPSSGSQLDGVFDPSMAQRWINAPPAPGAAKRLPRHLLLSVLRI